jgi:hypothetical protein
MLVSFEPSLPGTEEACHIPKTTPSSPILPGLLGSPWLAFWCLAREVLPLCGVYTAVKECLKGVVLRTSVSLQPSVKKDCGCSERHL